MALNVKNTKELCKPENLKLKILAYGMAGVGKTSFLGTVPDIGIAACETGNGKGLVSLMERGIDYVEPTTQADFDAICSGLVFKDKSAIGLDSLSDMTTTFIKDYALSMPRARGATDKRKAGVPELDDYQVMGEVTRRILRKLLDGDKHVIATAGLRIDKPDMESGQTDTLVGPALPGSLFLGSTAMFDLVLCLRTRSVLRDPKDPKSRYQQRYFVTESNGGIIAKGRYTANRKSILAPEEVFDLETGQGTFEYFLNKIKAAYAESLAKAA